MRAAILASVILTAFVSAASSQQPISDVKDGMIQALKAQRNVGFDAYAACQGLAGSQEAKVSELQAQITSMRTELDKAKKELKDKETPPAATQPEAKQK